MLNTVTKHQQSNIEDIKKQFNSYFSELLRIKQSIDTNINISRLSKEDYTNKSYYIIENTDIILKESYDPICNLMFKLRKNFFAMKELIYFFKQSEQNDLTDLLSSQFYENILVNVPDQNEILILITALLADEVGQIKNNSNINNIDNSNNSCSIYFTSKSFLATSFVGKLLKNLSKNQTVKQYIHQLLSEIIVKVDSSQDSFMDIEIEKIIEYIEYTNNHKSKNNFYNQEKSKSLFKSTKYYSNIAKNNKSIGSVNTRVRSYCTDDYIRNQGHINYNNSNNNKLNTEETYFKSYTTDNTKETKEENQNIEDLIKYTKQIAIKDTFATDKSSYFNIHSNSDTKSINDSIDDSIMEEDFLEKESLNLTIPELKTKINNLNNINLKSGLREKELLLLEIYNKHMVKALSCLTIDTSNSKAFSNSIIDKNRRFSKEEVKNNNIYTTYSLNLDIKNFIYNNEQYIKMSDQILNLYKESINKIKNILFEFFLLLEEKIDYMPYSIRAICKVIYLLVVKKFYKNNFCNIKNCQAEIDTFISEFFFGKLLLPIIISPDYATVITNKILSINTRKYLVNLSKIIKKISRYELFESNFENIFTVFNCFILDIMPLLNKIYKKLIDVPLSNIIEEIITDTQYYYSSSFSKNSSISNNDQSDCSSNYKLNNKNISNNTIIEKNTNKTSNNSNNLNNKSLSKSLTTSNKNTNENNRNDSTKSIQFISKINFDYFKNLKDELVHTNAICFSANDVLLIIEAIKRNLIAFTSNPVFSPLVKSYKKLTFQSDYLRSLTRNDDKLNVRRYFIIYRHDYNPNFNYLLIPKKSVFTCSDFNELNSEENQCFILERIKYCINYILRQLNIINEKSYHFLNKKNTYISNGLSDCVSYSKKSNRIYNSNNNKAFNKLYTLKNNTDISKVSNNLNKSNSSRSLEINNRKISQEIVCNMNNTTNFFYALNEIIKLEDQNLHIDKIPLTWYSIYLNSNLSKLDYEYSKNDYENLYKELLEEALKERNLIQEKTNTIITSLGLNIRCAEKKIEDLVKDKFNVINIERLIRVDKFLSSLEINFCIRFSLKNISNKGNNNYDSSFINKRFKNNNLSSFDKNSFNSSSTNENNINKVNICKSTSEISLGPWTISLTNDCYHNIQESHKFDKLVDVGKTVIMTPLSLISSTIRKKNKFNSMKLTLGSIEEEHGKSVSDLVKIIAKKKEVKYEILDGTNKIQIYNAVNAYIGLIYEELIKDSLFKNFSSEEIAECLELIEKTIYNKLYKK